MMLLCPCREIIDDIGGNIMDAYKIGFVAGFLAVVIVALIARKFFHREPTVYDERQEKVRGIAYKYAFMACMIAGVAYIFMCGVDLDKYVESSLAMFVVIIAGVITYAAYCIANGAYFGINNNKKKWIALDLAIIVINGACAVNEYMIGGFADNGVLTLSGNANLICAVAFGAVLIALLVMNHREAAREDEES